MADKATCELDRDPGQGSTHWKAHRKVHRKPPSALAEKAIYYFC